MTINWTDPTLVPGTTPVKTVHVDELRTNVDYTKSEIDSFGNIYQDEVGTANAYKVNIANYTGYIVGRPIYFRADNSNTGASTMQVNSLPAKPLYKNNDEDLEVNDIQVGQVVQVVYDGTNFQIVASGAPTAVTSIRFTNFVTLGSDLSSMAVGISEYTPATDYLTVFVNGVRINNSATGADNYTLDETNKIVTKVSGTWVAGTVLSFVVDKFVYSTMKFTTGASLYDETVSLYKLEPLPQGAILQVINKGDPNTLAPLDADAKVPVVHVPDLDYVGASEKGVALGVATLDASAKLPLAMLPSLDAEIKYKGHGTFNASTGVTLTHNLNLAATEYYVNIMITSNPAGFLGEVWVIKSTNSITVYCSGTTTKTTFDCIIV